MKLWFAVRPWLPAVAIWLVSGSVLSAATTRIGDWFVMTDELLYERLALSVDRLGTPFPHIHGEAVSNLNQLYPLLLAIPFRHGFVLHGFHQAHFLNAFAITSAAVPAYLFARRLTGSRLLSATASFATVTVVWVTLASFLLTEIVAYPMFVWAVYACHRAMIRPGPRGDLLAVAGIALAVLARTQLYVLAAILPAAIVGRALVEHSLRETIRAHRTLIAIYAIGVAAGAGLSIAGKHVLGAYSQTAHGNPLPLSLFKSVPAHLSVVAVATGLIPLLIGGAWLVANLRRSESPELHAFAWLATVGIVGLIVEAASFDERFGGGVVRDRYAFYAAPLLFLALAVGLKAARPPKAAIVIPLVLFAIGALSASFPSFEKLNADTPASAIDSWLVPSLHGLTATRWFLILGAGVLALVYLEGIVLGFRRVTTTVLCVGLLVALPAQTAYAFKRLFAVNGTSGLPMTLDQSPVFEWIDQEINTENRAMIVPYPVIPADYWANVGFWWDLEFWNRTVVGEIGRPNEFSGTPPGTFPKLNLRFDPATGRASSDLDTFVAQAVGDARFRLAGTVRTNKRNMDLIAPTRPWRAAWVSYGLYDDGWTRPRRAARLRIFADPDQRGSLRRALTIRLGEPNGPQSRAVSFASNLGDADVTVTADGLSDVVYACVPPHGHADISVSVDESSGIPPDLKNADTYLVPRQGGVQFQQIALADETSAC